MLVITLVVLAIAQALMVMLTFHRDREIQDLRETLDQQRLLIAEIKGWLNGRQSRRQIRPPTRDDIRPEPETEQSATARLAKVHEFFKDDIATARNLTACMGRKAEEVEIKK